MVIGGGLGGLEAAKHLARLSAAVTVVDRRDHHFLPLLPRVVAGKVKPESAVSPLAHKLSSFGAGLHRGSVVAVDRQRRLVELAEGDPLPYDFLIVAAGAEASFDRHPEWRRRVTTLKTVEDALRIRTHVEEAFAAARSEGDPERRRHLLSFAVVGGGPTGVELAGHVGELIQATKLEPENLRLSATPVALTLVHGGQRVLPSFSLSATRHAEAELAHLGFTLKTNTRVTDIRPTGIETERGFVAAKNVLWAAGVRGGAETFGLGSTDQRGRLVVEQDLSIPGDPRVFVIGDAAAAGSGGSAVPGVAQAAMQGGKHVAGAIASDLKGAERPRFVYHDPGSAVQVSSRAAIVETLGQTLTGPKAAMLISAIHAVHAPAGAAGGSTFLGGLERGRPDPEPALGNDFKAKGEGRLSAAGGMFEQLHQTKEMALLTAAATRSTAGQERIELAEDCLQKRRPSTLIAGAPVAERHYQSSIKEHAPEAVFQLLANNLRAAFENAGVHVAGEIPAPGGSRRLMLEEAGPPPIWAPIEVEIDATRLSVRISTLAGHPLRGTNDFAFLSDGNGGTVIEQESTFQASSALVSTLGNAFGVEGRQDDLWRLVHAFLSKAAGA